MRTPVDDADDRTGLLEHAQVPADRGLGDFEVARGLADGQLGAGEAFDDAAADRVRAGGEGAIQRRLVSHPVNYYHAAIIDVVATDDRRPTGDAIGAGLFASRRARLGDAAPCAASGAAAATAPTTVLVGHSVRGRAIVAHVLGAPTAKRRVLLVGCIHGNECAGQRSSPR